jgi:intracellular multiplication protein IcmG
MLNDRDDQDKHEEDSEYHFTDTDGEEGYEIDEESPHAQTSIKPSSEVMAARPFQPRRLLISVLVFFIFLYIVYKMVAPTSTVPSTNIATVPPSTTNTAAVVQQKPQGTQQMPVAKPAAIPSQQQAPVMQQQANIPAQPTMPSPPPSLPGQNMPAQQQSMPAVIPVQSAQPVYNVNQPSPTMPSNMQMLSSDSEKLMGQLQTETMQKLNEFSSQNKSLQEQVQSLNTRVVEMENQINRLVQALTRQEKSPDTDSAAANAGGQDTEAISAGEKSSYSVQAIIPGRAWLKAENGETLTVTEGDVVKGLGRVTKIDPYDGLVVINTGNKIISLSYGNGS